MKTILTLLLTIISFSVFSQQLEISSTQTVKLDKDVLKNGLYAGTYVENNEVEVLYYLGGGKSNTQLYSYRFDNNLTPANAGTASKSNDSSYEWMVTQDDIDKFASGNERFFYAKSNLMGALMVQFGAIEKKYTNGIFVDWKFKKDERLKAKNDEIMKIMPAGFKSLSDYSRMNTAYGFSEELPKYGNSILAPVGSKILSAGVIVEKISIKNPPKTNFNRIAAVTISGETLEDVEIQDYLLPYSATAVTSGETPGNILGALFAPAFARSTVAEHKKLVWKDRMNHFTFMRFADDLSLVDSVSFNSKLMFGNFNIFPSNEAALIIGIGDKKYDDWYRKAYAPTEFKRIDGFQFTKIKDGNLLYNAYFTDDDLESKLVTAKGEKAKFNFDPNFKILELIALKNGNDFVLGVSPLGYFAFQIDAAGELMAYYQFNRIDEKNSDLYNYQYLVKDDQLYLVLNEQKKELTNETQVEHDSYTTTNFTSKTTTVKRLNEVYLLSKIVKIDTNSKNVSNAITIGKDYMACGSYPVLFSENEMFITGKDGPKGKELFLTKIQL